VDQVATPVPKPVSAANFSTHYCAREHLAADGAALLRGAVAMTGL
jgi:hypothetical protein